jgi:molecular chaperone DnaJ
LYIYIEVEPHPFLKRDGSILYCEIPITIAQAALGGSVRVPTLEGHADLNVPPGTQSGAQLRLRGLGMPDLRGYHQGDLIVRVVVETPVKLSRRQRDLLKEFEDLSDRKTHPLHSQFKEQIERR